MNPLRNIRVWLALVSSLLIPSMGDAAEVQTLQDSHRSVTAIYGTFVAQSADEIQIGNHRIHLDGVTVYSGCEAEAKAALTQTKDAVHCMIEGKPEHDRYEGVCLYYIPGDLYRTLTDLGNQLIERGLAKPDRATEPFVDGTIDSSLHFPQYETSYREFETRRKKGQYRAPACRTSSTERNSHGL